MIGRFKVFGSTIADSFIKTLVPLIMSSTSIIYNNYLSEYFFWGLLIFFVFFAVISYFVWYWVVKTYSTNKKVTNALKGTTLFLSLIVLFVFGYLARNYVSVSTEYERILIMGTSLTAKGMLAAKDFIEPYDIYRYCQRHAECAWVNVRLMEIVFYVIICLFCFFSMGAVAFLRGASTATSVVAAVTEVQAATPTQAQPPVTLPNTPVQ